jgi:hypothetical protein
MPESSNRQVRHLSRKIVKFEILSRMFIISFAAQHIGPTVTEVDSGDRHPNASRPGFRFQILDFRDFRFVGCGSIDSCPKDESALFRF